MLTVVLVLVLVLVLVIDIILAEVDLPVTKCFKMLKYIARNKDLRHIPIISKLPYCSLCLLPIPVTWL